MTVSVAGEFAKDTEGKIHPWAMQAKMKDIANSPEDYKRFYHNVNGKKNPSRQSA